MDQGLFDELTEMSARNSLNFCDPGVRAARQRAREKSQVNAANFGCMDGRTDMQHITETLPGTIESFKNIGGIFEIGWPALSDRIGALVDRSISEGRRNLFLVTYHYAAGDKHRGCRGVDYDTAAGIAHARRFASELHEVFGWGHEQVYIIVVGIETDEDALILHDRSGERTVSVTSLLDADKQTLVAVLRDLYPDMHFKVVGYLRRLIRGNIAHVNDLRRNPRPPVAAEHTERIVAVGDGLDWLTKPNFVITVNHYHPMLDDTIGTATGIVIGNRDAGRIPATGGILLASAEYREPGFRYLAAKKRALYLARLGMESIRKFHPNVNGFFDSVAAVVNMNERKLEILEVNGRSV